MWLNGNPLLHIVDTQTRFQNAILFKREYAKDVWDEFVEGWQSVYIGYSNRIRTDRGSISTSKFWRGVTTLHGTDVQLSGVEIHNSIGVGERYHEPLRQVFDKVLTDHPTTDPDIGLCVAVKALTTLLAPRGSCRRFSYLDHYPLFLQSTWKSPYKKGAWKHCRQRGERWHQLSHGFAFRRTFVQSYPLPYAISLNQEILFTFIEKQKEVQRRLGS